MPPEPVSEVVRRRMQAQSRYDTRPEVRLRKLLWAKGFRYRVGYPVPGHPRRSIDIAFPGKRLAVFVDGCFWHNCPDHSVPVKNNQDWWHAKLAKNVERDGETTSALQAQGWQVLRVWEHTTPTEAADRVEQILIGIEHASRLSPPQP